MYAMDEYAPPPPLMYTSFSQCQSRKQQGLSMCVVAAIVVVLIALYMHHTPMKSYQPSAIMSQCAAGLSTITNAFQSRLNQKGAPSNTTRDGPHQGPPPRAFDYDDDEDGEDDE